MIPLRHADISLELDDGNGGRAVSWKVGNHELLGRNSDHAIDSGMYPMAPWAGRIRGNMLDWQPESRSLPVNFGPWAIHGLVLSSPFEVISQERNHAVLQREFGDAWPVRGGVRCAWTVDEEGLTTEITCFAQSGEFPAVVGWHPWFTREVAGITASWATDCDELLVRGADDLPTGDRLPLDRPMGTFDDVLTGGMSASLEWPGLLRVDIRNSHPWFVVYDATDRFICIEPQTGPADGLSGRHAPVTLVNVDQPLVMRTRWQVTRAQQAGSA